MLRRRLLSLAAAVVLLAAPAGAQRGVTSFRATGHPITLTMHSWSIPAPGKTYSLWLVDPTTRDPLTHLWEVRRATGFPADADPVSVVLRSFSAGEWFAFGMDWAGEWSYDFTAGTWPDETFAWRTSLRGDDSNPVASFEISPRAFDRFDGYYIATPEPGTVVLVGSGLLALGGLVQRRRRSQH